MTRIFRGWISSLPSTAVWTVWLSAPLLAVSLQVASAKDRREARNDGQTGTGGKPVMAIVSQGPAHFDLRCARQVAGSTGFDGLGRLRNSCRHLYHHSEEGDAQLKATMEFSASLAGQRASPPPLVQIVNSANARLIVCKMYSRSSAIKKCEPLRTWLVKPPRVNSPQPTESSADTQGSKSPIKLLIGNGKGSTGRCL